MSKKFTLSYIRLCVLFALSCFSWSNANAQTCTAPFFGSGCTSSYFLAGFVVSDLNVTVPSSACATPALTSDTAHFCAGASDSMWITVAGDMGVGLYIDWNNDGVFQSSEFVYGNYNTAQQPTYGFLLNIPSTQTGGTFTARVAASYMYGFTSADTCGYITGYYGNYYDFKVSIVDTLRITSQPAPVSGCIGSAVNFTLGTSGHFINYQWYKDGTAIAGATGATYTIASFKASDTASKIYAIATNSCSMATSDTVSLFVKTPPPATAVALGPTSFCPGGSVILRGDTVSSGNTFKWLYNGALSKTNHRDTVTLPGTYTFIISNGCADTATNIVVANYPVSVPTITPGGLNKVCNLPTPVQFATPAAPGVQYQWQVNTGAPNVYQNIAGDTLNFMTATTTGYYRLMLTDDTNHCVNYSVASTLQENNPATDTVINHASDYLCAGGYVTLLVSSNDTGEKFRWQFNGVAITPSSSATGSSYNAYQPGTYSVVGNNGCQVISNSVTLMSIPFPKIDTGGPVSFCGGGSVMLSSHVTDTNFRYQWQKNGVDIAGATATYYTVTDSGYYSVVLISQNTCTASSLQTKVTVWPLPSPIINLGTDGITLTVAPYYAKYLWYFNGTAVADSATAHAASFQAIAPGSYTVSVVDDNGCTGTSAPFQAPGQTSVGNVPGPESISVYPNPASSVVRINAPVTVNVYLATIDGRIVLSQTAAKQIDIRSVADGIYMLRITDENGNTLKVEKLTKSNQ